MMATDEEREQAAQARALAMLDAECIERYLARGRRHAELPIDALRAEWCAAWRQYFHQRDQAASDREADAAGELLLRGISPQSIADATPDITQKLAQMARALPATVEEFDPDGALERSVGELMRKHGITH